MAARVTAGGNICNSVARCSKKTAAQMTSLCSTSISGFNVNISRCTGPLTVPSTMTGLDLEYKAKAFRYWDDGNIGAQSGFSNTTPQIVYTPVIQ